MASQTRELVDGRQHKSHQGGHKNQALELTAMRRFRRRHNSPEDAGCMWLDSSWRSAAAGKLPHPQDQDTKRSHFDFIATWADQESGVQMELVLTIIHQEVANTTEPQVRLSVFIDDVPLAF